MLTERLKEYVCCSLHFSCFANEPTEEQVDEVKEEIGGMWCIQVKIYNVPDGEIVKGEIYDGAICRHDFAVTDDVLDYCIVCGETRPAANANR